MLLVLSKTFFSFSQGINAAENEWLIKPFLQDHDLIAKKFNEISDAILLGDYEKGKKLIAAIQSNNSAVGALKYIYQANIAYNESQFQASIDYCHQALTIRKYNYADRLVLRALNFKAKASSALNKYEISIGILDTVLIIASEIKDQYNLSAAHYYLGSIYSEKGEYLKAINEIKMSIRIKKKINDQIGLAASYSFLGLCYAGIDNYSVAIDYIKKSELIRLKYGDKRGLANSYLTMYKVYFELGEINKAMESEIKSLNICTEINDKQCISGRYTNLGVLYQLKGDLTRSMEFHIKALKLSKELNIKGRIALVYENIAKIKLVQHDFDAGIKYLDSSYQIRNQLGDVEGLASCYLVKSSILLGQKNINDAIIYAQKAIDISSKLKLFAATKEAHQILSKCYEIKKDYHHAFFHFKRFITLKDSLFSETQSKELLRRDLEFDFQQQKEKTKLLNDQKEAKAKAKSDNLKNIITYIILGLIIVSLMLLFSIRQYQLKNKSKIELEKIHEQLIENKNIIEHQHREITDSIRYAQKIQWAVLPSKDELNRSFVKNYVIFQPKDDISGDFYWTTSIKDHEIIVTADCTGHGVPGGFMSMLGISLLNDIIIEQKNYAPASILDKLREKVIQSLKQKGKEGEQKDGMDMTICILNTKTKILKYASANHVMYLLRESELIEYKGNKFPVGIFGNQLEPFSEQEIQLIKSDRIFTFTDGLPDQFGGDKGKKFKYQQLRNIIIESRQLSLQEQGTLLEKSFVQWKGKLEQTDDVTLIAFEI